MKTVALRCSLLVICLLFQMIAVTESFAAESRWIRQVQGKTKVIVFVHGVIGDSTSTWTNSQTGAYWPSLVATDADFDKSNVYVFQYPSPPVGGSLSVNELAEAMRRRLQADRVLNYPELRKV